MARNLPTILQDIEARASALRRYARCYDLFCEREQTDTLSGDVFAAARAAGWAQVCLRAYRNELDNPTPPALDDGQRPDRRAER
jgi:hypothetical protein